MASVVIWTPEALQKLASKYETIKEFRQNHPGAYQVAWKKGLLNTLNLRSRVPNHTNNNRSQPHLWSLDVVKAEAQKYDSRSAFHLGSPSAYMSARRYGWLDQLGFPEKQLKWTYESVKAEAQKYDSRSLFAFGNRAAYNKARQMRWLDEFFPQ